MSDDRIERALREKGPRELGGPPMLSLPDDLREARTLLRSVERGRRFRALVGGGLGTLAAAAVVVTLVVLLVPPSPTSLAPGAGESASSSPAPATAVATTPSPAATPSPALTPSPTPVATPAPVLACTPADLTATDVPWGGAAGSVGTTVTVTNSSGVACTVSGRPGGRLATAGGTLVTVAGDATTTAPQTIQPGGTLITTLRWSNWCGTAPSGTISATLVLPGGDLAVTPGATQSAVPVPPCNGPGQPSSLATIDFQAP